MSAIITDANFKDVSDAEFLTASDLSGDWTLDPSLIPGSILFKFHYGLGLNLGLGL